MLDLGQKEKIDVADLGPGTSQFDLDVAPIIQPMPASDHFNKQQRYIMMEEIYEESQESDQTGAACGNLSSASLLK